MYCVCKFLGVLCWIIYSICLCNKLKFEDRVVDKVVEDVELNRVVWVIYVGDYVMNREGNFKVEV